MPFSSLMLHIFECRAWAPRRSGFRPSDRAWPRGRRNSLERALQFANQLAACKKVTVLTGVRFVCCWLDWLLVLFSFIYCICWMKSSQWMWLPKDLIPFMNLFARSMARFLSFWTMTRTVWVWTAWFNALRSAILVRAEGTKASKIRSKSTFQKAKDEVSFLWRSSIRPLKLLHQWNPSRRS